MCIDIEIYLCYTTTVRNDKKSFIPPVPVLVPGPRSLRRTALTLDPTSSDHEHC